MYAVTPKSDCPHLETSFSISDLPETIEIDEPCTNCQDTSENWICLKCFGVHCSRFVNEHASKHYDSSKHAVAASFSDFSVWCYECESYIKHPTLEPILTLLNKAKFENAERAEVVAAETSESEDDELSVDLLGELMANSFSAFGTSQIRKEECFLKDLTLHGIADAINQGKCKNIIVMSGAGISVAAGIPDFRSPGTGLYYNLQKYNLPEPEAVFDINYFRTKPEPFFTLAKELYPGNFKPTKVHYFIRLLQQKGLLLRNFTQNIDTLERVAEIPGEFLVEAHGSFAASHCIDCKTEYSVDWVKERVFGDVVPRCTKCNGLVKPDIIFFGESLPALFFDKMVDDFPKCDLLIVIGTSLQVQPFASLIHRVPSTTPRLLINRDEVGKTNPIMARYGLAGDGFRFGLPSNYRDVAVLGDCQWGVEKLAELLGWEEELKALVQSDNNNNK